MTINQKKIEMSYTRCQNMALSHYENFPVASKLLPKNIRKSIAAVYAFARIADDISDEGHDDNNTRIKKLSELSLYLEEISTGKIIDHPYFCALSHTIHTHNIPVNLLFDLLHAFKQDVHKSYYENLSEVLNYCKYSANPIGRILLHLCNHDNEENLKLSDNLCTAFQLINFAQDIHLDIIHRHRCYIPLDMQKKHGICTDDIRTYRNTDSFIALSQEFIMICREIFNRGYPLGYKLSGKFGLEMKMTVCAVNEVLRALENRQSPYDKPILRKSVWPKIIFKSIFFNFFKAPQGTENDKLQPILP
ncbi:MAG: squalene synthase HpnC [Francisellaceae bacterium]|mgnify:CR=1 FL=1|jgi:hydroxysqualene synthase|nr:squalene synthase HpnC [Francisellaceae bacterium]MBT6206508.1 squalene synthase HpnC [Francisellaceae bacterium]MBT6539470.1 squalene synthase HpnC [Francisellaceae bacterium]